MMFASAGKFSDDELLIFITEELSLRRLDPEDQQFIDELAKRLESSLQQRLSEEERKRIAEIAKKYGIVEIGTEAELHEL